MSDTIESLSTPQASQRAAIARVTLQIRQTLDAADAIERQMAVAEQTARLELRERLEGLREQRRLQLEVELERRRAECAERIDAARRQVAPQPGPSTALVPATAGVPTMVTVDVDTLARVCAMVVTEVLEQRYGQQANTMVWSAPQIVPVPAPLASIEAGVAVAPAIERPPSFWRNLWSTDVVLIGVAATIIAVVLAAWLG